MPRRKQRVGRDAELDDDLDGLAGRELDRRERLGAGRMPKNSVPGPGGSATPSSTTSPSSRTARARPICTEANVCVPVSSGT